MIKITQKDIDKGKHNPKHELSEKLAPLAALVLLAVIIWALFV